MILEYGMGFYLLLLLRHWRGLGGDWRRRRRRRLRYEVWISERKRGILKEIGVWERVVHDVVVGGLARI